MDMLETKLSYEEFLEVVNDLVSEMIPEGTWVEKTKTLKFNSVELDGLTFHEGEGTVCPTVYLRDFYELYESGKSLDSVCRAVVRVFTECKKPVSSDFLDSFDYEDQKDSIIFRLINAEMNRELLEKMPHILLYDLAVVFSCLVCGSDEEQGTIRITNDLCEHWKVGVEELLEQAKRNTARLLPYSLTDIVTTLESIVRKKIATATDSDTVNEAREQLDLLLDPAFTDSMSSRMYVLTNSVGVGGAATLLYDGVTEEIRERLGCDYYIIPSSVSEIIIVPEGDETDPETLREMIREVNATGVPPQEILSDELYHYPENDFKI